MSRLCRLTHAEKVNCPRVLLCRVLHVTRSSCYAGCEGEAARGARQAADNALAQEITRRRRRQGDAHRASLKSTATFQQVSECRRMAA